MRDIKFRGKRLDNDYWLYGSLVHIEDDRYAILPTINSMHGETIAMYEVAPDTIGQYIGVKDTRGIDIYDGDIIECISSSGKPIRHYIKFCKERGYYAQYDNVTWGGELNECGPIWQHYIDEFGKYVIGNIYDHQHLLK